MNLNLFNKKEILLIIIFICTFLLINIHSRQKKKKPKAPKKQFNPKDKKPSRIKDDLYCEICREIVKETARSLYNKKKDYEVIEAIEKVCDSEYLYPHQNEYAFRRDACEVFVAGWNEDLEKVLVKRKDDESPINELCFDITKACDFEFKASNPEQNEYALEEDLAKKDEI